jgi:hypothetical protein
MDDFPLFDTGKDSTAMKKVKPHETAFEMKSSNINH